MIGLTLLAVYVASIVACHYIAKHRGAQPVFWGWVAFMVGPLALPFVFFARPQQRVVRGHENR
jgi:hypothetical protein